MNIDSTTSAWSNVRRRPARALLIYAAIMTAAVALLGGARPALATTTACPNPAIVGEWTAFLNGTGVGATAGEQSNSPTLAGRWGKGKGQAPERGGSPALVGGWAVPRTAERVARGLEQPALEADGAGQAAGATGTMTLVPTTAATPPPPSTSAPAPALVTQQVIYFDSAVAVSRPQSDAALDDVGQTLTQWPQTTLEVAGHADNRGSDAFNELLARARAQGALDALVERFPDIDAQRVTVVAYGEAQPLASNDSYVGRARNRRVELKVFRAELARK
jgi:outer membrane protein OmpA-like peptidoglycan-associated protein